MLADPPQPLYGCGSLTCIAVARVGRSSQVGRTRGRVEAFMLCVCGFLLHGQRASKYNKKCEVEFSVSEHGRALGAPPFHI